MTLGPWPLTLRAYLASLAVSGQRWRKATCGDELRPCTHFCARSLFHAPVSHWRLTMLPDHPSSELVLILEHWALSLAKAQSWDYTPCVSFSPTPLEGLLFSDVILFSSVSLAPSTVPAPQVMCVCVFQPLFTEWVNGVKC